MNDMNRPNNTLAIIGLVLGIVAVLVSFFPCVGMFAILPGLAGAILALIAFLKARDNGHPKGLAIAGIVVSVIACLIAIFQIFFLGNMASDMKENMKEYTSCEEMKADYDKASADLKSIEAEMEGGSPSFSNISRIARLSAQVAHIKEQSKKLDCNIDIESMEDMGDDMMEEEVQEEGEGEMNEEMQEEEENNNE